MKKPLHTKEEQGFTIVETLVAIFILLVSITGPLAFAQNGLRASFVARDQIVAFYLAQDAIETIKNMRDNNALDGEEWMSELVKDRCVTTNNGGGVGHNKSCNLDTVSSSVTVQTCGASQCPAMKYDSAQKEYRIGTASSPGVTSKFTRTIYMYEMDNDDREMQIIVDVAWDTNFFSNRHVYVQEYIYNWVPEFTP